MGIGEQSWTSRDDCHRDGLPRNHLTLLNKSIPSQKFSVCINWRRAAPAQQLSHLSHPIYTPDILSIDVNRSRNRFANMVYMNRRDRQRVCHCIKSWRERRRGRPAHGSKCSEKPRRRGNPFRYFGVKHGRNIQESRQWGRQRPVVWVVDQTYSIKHEQWPNARCGFILTGPDVHSSQVRMTKHQLVDSNLCFPLHLDVVCGYPGPENIFC